MQRLYMTQPYYSTPASFFVREDSPVARPAELKGKQIGACAGCTHESYLKRELELPGVEQPRLMIEELLDGHWDM